MRQCARRARSRRYGGSARTSAVLVLRGVVEPRVGSGHVADAVLEQPPAVARVRRLSLVEDPVALEVELPQPSAREREARRDVRRLPVVERLRDLDAFAVRAARVEPVHERLVVGPLRGRVVEAFGCLAQRSDHLPGEAHEPAPPRPRVPGALGPRASRTASSSGPPNSEPSRVMLPPSGFGEHGRERRERRGTRQITARTSRSRSRPRVAISASTQNRASGHHAENQNGNCAALGEQQPEQPRAGSALPQRSRSARRAAAV